MKLLLLLPPVEVKDEGRLSLLRRRRAAPVVALRPGLEIGILLDVGVEMLDLCLRLRAFVIVLVSLLVALAPDRIVFTSHPIVTLKNPKADTCFRLNNNNNNSLIKMLLLHVSATVTNRLIPTVLNVPPTVSACSIPDSIVRALVDDGFIPNVLDTSFMLVLMAERKVPFCGRHFIIPTT
jgi:hypothetical protein